MEHTHEWLPSDEVAGEQVCNCGSIKTKEGRELELVASFHLPDCKTEAEAIAAAKELIQHMRTTPYATC